MKLVKDLTDEGIVFYWVNDKNIQISRPLPTLDMADEWRCHHLFRSYKGVERRRSIIDRRNNDRLREAMVKNYISSQASPHGRRICDNHAKVDIDLVKKKIAEFY